MRYTTRKGPPTPMLSRLLSPYFLVFEVFEAAFFAGFAFAFAMASSPSFAYAPGSYAKA